jgi:hypothetical protein
MYCSKKSDGIGHVLNRLKTHHRIKAAVIEVLYKTLPERKIINTVVRRTFPGQSYRQRGNVDSQSFANAWSHRAQDQSFRAANVQHPHVSRNTVPPDVAQRVSGTVYPDIYLSLIEIITCRRCGEGTPVELNL